jgi:hypothetical protein
MTPEKLRVLADERDEAADAWPEYPIVATKFREDATALRAAADRIDAVRGEVIRYAGWHEQSPEDSWRFERDIRTALGMGQYNSDDRD